ncbi:MAG TPA: hypothetical protein DCX52_15830 [Massilia sp.]|nr:hypothetical protein [Massilia sp.]
MIKLEKGAAPNILIEKSAEWTAALLSKIHSGEKPTDAEKGRYRHPEIKQELIKETAGKCAYCESKLTHIAYGDIEHIIPKSSTPEKSFDWENLTLACDICNTQKGANVINEHVFIDPYLVDPAKHFYFAGPLLMTWPGSEAAKLTEILLDLNRTPLFEKRKEKIDYLAALVESCHKAKNPVLKRVLLEDMRNNELLGDKEYTALARCFLDPLIMRLEADLIMNV